MSNFNDYSIYYDLLYSDKDYRGEAVYVDKLIRRFSPNAGSVAEFGCGTGRHACELAGMGYKVHGIDMSPMMLRMAEDRLKGLDEGVNMPVLSLGDVTNVDLGRVFDVVISLFHVVSYQTSNNALLSCFRSARKHLEPGGIFAFDCWYGPAVLAMVPEVRVKRMENESFRIVRIAEPEYRERENTVIVRYEIVLEEKSSGDVRRFSEEHPMRFLFSPEISLVAEQTGFQVRHSEEWMTGAQPSKETWGVTFILEAV